MAPILIPVPEELNTPRLHLRACRAGDGALIYPVAAESAEELQRFLPWAEAGIFAESLEIFARRQHAYFILREQLNYLMFRRDSGEFVGVCGFVKCDWELRQFELGYWLATAQTGQGLMTEACQACIQLARDRFQPTKITLRCDAENAKSAAIARRLGMSQEAERGKWQRKAEGNWVTLREFGLVICCDT